MRTTPSDSEKMPTGIPYIIGNEAAERFSFYGMKAALAVFIVQYLHLMGSTATDAVSEATSAEWVHTFVFWVYITPLAGAIISDRFFGKYKTIIALSIVYCLGHFSLALMGIAGPAKWFLILGLGLITIGAGGIKPCVSAHVGDQFGPNNQHLLTRVFNWFYFSINLGSVISTLIIPWTLEWYGPHWAFGIPGALMAVATLAFWMGRNEFVHIPPAGQTFTNEIFSKTGLKTILKLAGVFAFISVFWSLFDQTATTWVFQSQDMDRNIFGINVLPSQIQAANPFLILVLIPVFTYIIYPNVDKFWKLTPLRKMGIGLFLTAASFALSALIQEWIGAGEKPTIWWQLLAYLLLTSGEIMVSIVGLEFAYRNSPKSMKSWIMAINLAAVASGNLLTAAVNSFIQVESPTKNELADYQKQKESGNNEAKTYTYAGLDGKQSTEDDIIITYNQKGAVDSRQVPGQESLKQAADLIQQYASENEFKFPLTEKGNALVAEIKDPWGNPLRYLLINSTMCRILSDGPDKTPLTQWDTGVNLEYEAPSTEEKKESILAAIQPEETWLESRKKELGIEEAEASSDPKSPFKREFIAGGQTKLQGASYFWFFTGLMFVTSLIFIPVSMKFKEAA
ncbi:proton-dependent oligopeptide transporter, POT family [Rubritalea squalenifaciens DSM 18772]|uniref:Proton-dependent oligopeptide transporter, POT family n=1 Tax=Rubritalea squalenifaciens DSM 18772 TaxID=1123071 RepID=A0A1M6N9Y4_9BACT|nr:POT family MFS transporter [Rubritalea squalenifaciens]SHJ92528.1 proton-dependent oligopeptide transporter, POT family [Rubritalea squalenifaciens DSM 18772]